MAQRPIRTAAILSTGTEILQGLYADTNAQWLAQQCARLGLRVVAIQAAPDDRDDLRHAVNSLIPRADLVVASGGLGPTEDDLNRWVFAEAWRQELVENEEAVRLMRERFSSRGRPMPESNRVQALLPRQAHILQNQHGTAPGFYIAPTADRPALLALPGPPRELKPMFLNQAEPLLRPSVEGATFSRLQILHLFGQPESTVNERIRDVFRWHPKVHLGILARNYGIDLRIHAQAESPDEVDRLVTETERKIRHALPADWIYGTGEENLPEVVGRLLRERRLKIATAESCTGGLMAKMITDLPGSSAYFDEGFITYSYESKTALLGVSPDLLAVHGAVSRECVEAMATGLRDRTGADLCVAISGIAGPDGAQPGKPVGTVFVAMARRAGPAVAAELRLVQDREMNRMLSALSALNMVRLELLREDLG